MSIKLGKLTAYDVKELSTLFSLDPQSVRSYIRAGKLKGTKVGVKWYVTEENIRAFLSGGSKND